MQMCSGSSFMNLWLSKYLMTLTFKNHAPVFPHYHIFILHLEIKLGIRLKHRHPSELKILKIILLSLPLDRSIHLTLRCEYIFANINAVKLLNQKMLKNSKCMFVNMNG